MGVKMKNEILKGREWKKIMKKRWVFLAAAALMLALTGCGQKKETTYNVVPEGGTLLENEDTETEQTQEEETTEEENAASGYSFQGVQEENWEDNFAVDAASAAEFGAGIKEAVAGKDIEKLADLTTFPVYVGLTEEGEIVETREDFIALGADALFTEELVNSIAGADESGLSASRAGFTLCSEDGEPSITFGVQDGKLGISGINY